LAACWSVAGSQHGGAAAFEEDDVAPLAVEAAQALAGADGAEACLGVEPEAAGVLGEDAGLDGPDAVGFGSGDERGQQRGSDAPAAGMRADVDAVLDDSGVAAAVGDGRGGDPAEHC